MPSKIDRTGEIMTNKWGTYKILKYINCQNIVVEQDDGYTFKTTYSHFKSKQLTGNRRKLSNRVGETVTNKHGTYTIIQYNSANDIMVERDDGYVFKCKYGDFKIGNIRGLNRYDLSQEYGICYSSNTNDIILFDIEDYERIKQHIWGVSIRNNNYKTVSSRINGKKVTLQTFLLGSKWIDHINCNPLDNRKSNLRPSVDEDGYNRNNLNVRLQKNNTSGHKGVYWKECENRWVGEVSYKGKHYMKRFKEDEFENACNWVDNKRIELHGEFANCG